MKHGGSQCFDRLQAFARTLNHSLRTPLAVIANDLQFLSARDATGVTAEALAQCRRISALLDEAAALGGAPFRPVLISVDELASTLGAADLEAAVRGSGSTTLFADPARFELMLRLGRTLVGANSLPSILLAAEDKAVRCVFAANSARAPIDLDTIAGQLFHILVDAHGGTLALSSDSLAIVIPEAAP